MRQVDGIQVACAAGLVGMITVGLLFFVRLAVLMWMVFFATR